MKILGMSAWFHDSSACLLVDGQPVAYAEEERFDRRKHTAGCPHEAIAYVLREGGLNLDDLDEVAFYLDPWSYLRTGARAVLANFPRSLGLVGPGSSTISPFRRLPKMLGLRRALCRQHEARGEFGVRFVQHYRTHQASAFFPSPFEDAAVLTMDFAVDGTTEVIAHGRGLDLEDRVVHSVPNGFALVYAALTRYLGFRYYDEYKVMGMAAYGEPRFLPQIEKLYRLDESSGELALDFRYFAFQNHGLSRPYTAAMSELFGPPRAPGAPLAQRDYDLAASLQEATNRYGLAMARVARERTGSRNLCLAGGVAQNCLMNQRIAESGLFENCFFQPLAGDVGGSLGAALYRHHAVHRRERGYRMSHLYLGPSYAAQAESAARRAGLLERPSPHWQRAVGRAIAEGKVVGFFHGRMEAGPRALGARSILADPRRADMKDILNARVKHREHFRPFAPAILADHVEEVFQVPPGCHSLPYMILTLPVRPAWRERVPAIVHRDGTARVQAVQREVAPDFWAVIESFREISGVPLVINTSFNDNEPIVCSPEHAIDCFKRTQIDLLALEGRLYYREDNRAVVKPEPEAL